MLLGGAVFAEGLGLTAPTAAEWSVHWRGNVTNADRAADRIDAWNVKVDIAGASVRLVDRRTGLTTGWQAGLEAWPDYPGLSSAQAGLVLGSRHKFGLGPLAPVLSLTGRLAARAGAERDRSVVGGAGQVELTKRVVEIWRLGLAYEWSREEAPGPVFDRVAREGTLRSELQLGRRWGWTLSVSQRQGDVVSYSRPPRPDLVQAGKKLVLVDTFRQGTPLLAYYFPAETTSVAGELAFDRTERRTWFARVEYRDTRDATQRYLNTSLAVGLRHRW